MPTTKAHMQATGRYEAKAYDKILIRIRKDGKITRDMIAAAADQAGESVNAYVINAVKMRLNQTKEEQGQRN